MDFPWNAYSQWLDPPEPITLTDHEIHVIRGEFPVSCEECQDEKCLVCFGSGFVGEGTVEEGCLNCRERGRV